MKSEISPAMNVWPVGLALIILVVSGGGERGGAFAYFLAFAIAAAGVLLSAWTAAIGEDDQLVAGPIAGILLVAILGNFHEISDFRAFLEAALISVALGVPIVATMVPGRSAKATMIAGAVSGWIGVSVALTAITLHVPIFSLFVGLGHLQTFDPFHIGFFQPSYSDAELADRVAHNATLEQPGVPWRGGLFLIQTILVSAWDALILGVCVWIVGLFVSLPVRAMPEQPRTGT